jgi:predicted Zn-dependent protease with MMP-like domain
MAMTETMAPDLLTIERLARSAMAGLPALFRNHLDSVVLRVEPFPDAEVMAEMELDSEWDLLGLYWGRPVGEKGVEPTGAMPDMIFLYGQPLLAEWCAGEDSLEALVTHVLVHEVGHHFGLSDADMQAIEASCR